MVTDQHREEQLSRAFVQAIVAQAGMSFDRPSDDYGVDGTVRPIVIYNGRRLPSGHTLDVQLKATTNWSQKDEHIIYDLEVKTYNDLVFRFNQPRGTPMVLVVLCLPKDENQWLTISHDQLILRHCCYWCHLGSEHTKNAKSKRIEIPKSNIWNHTTVSTLLDKISKGERLE